MAQRDKLEWIQALRGIAALLVVITHARRYLLESDLRPFVEHYIRPAAQGVDLFFLVSGFIMVYTTRDSDGSLRYASKFLIKRFARVWPVHVVAVLAWIALAAATSLPVASATDILKSLAFLPVSTGQPPYLGLPYAIGWTLNYEFYFYLIFAASMLFGSARWVAYLLWLVATLILVPLLFAGRVSFLADNNYQFGPTLANQITNPMVWEFAVGALIGLLYKSNLRIPRSRLSDTLIVSCVLLILSTSWQNESWIYGPMQWGAPLALMFAVMALTFKDYEPRVPRSLVWLGGISYSLYLMHYIVFGMITSIFALMHVGKLVWTPTFAVLVILPPIFVAALSTKHIENGLSVKVRDRMLAWHGKIFSRRNGAAVEWQS